MTAHLIIGGGPAGAVLGGALAKQGHEATILERTDGAHHKVCGEFLSWETRTGLTRWGFDPARLGGEKIGRLHVIVGDRLFRRRLPGTALGISRYRLDEALLEQAAVRGADVRRGVTARALTAGTVRCDGACFSGARTYLATGKHDLRGARRERTGTADGLTGFKMHYRLGPAAAEAIANTVELHHFPLGYAGLQPIEDGRANLCLLLRTGEVGGSWQEVLSRVRDQAPVLALRLRGGRPLFDRPLAIARVPYGFVDRSTGPEIRLGDQQAVIHSFTGAGMSIAITTALLAARARERGAADVNLLLQNITRGPVRRASIIHGLLAKNPATLRLALAVPGGAALAARMTRMPLL